MPAIGLTCCLLSFTSYMHLMSIILHLIQYCYVLYPDVYYILISFTHDVYNSPNSPSLYNTGMYTQYKISLPDVYSPS